MNNFLVTRFVGSARCVGFSGSRSPSELSLSVLGSVCGLVSPSSPVVVGCARGVDELVRLRFPSAEVFEVASGSFGVGRGAFAARSVGCVRRVRELGGVWVSFPSSPCPSGLLPSSSSSRCFSGAGSGTWASAAFAIGSGVPCLLWLPPGVSVPSGWGLSESAGFAFWEPAAVQLSLF